MIQMNCNFLNATVLWILIGGIVIFNNIDENFNVQS